MTQRFTWYIAPKTLEYKEFLGCLTDIKSENLQFFILRHVYRKSVRNEELPQKCKVDIKLNSLREVRKSTFFSTLKHFLSLAFLCVFGAEICKIFWENAEILIGTVPWLDSNTLQKFQFFIKWKNLRRDKTINLNEHLDDPGWSRSRGIKNSYHKWIHMATTNEVHYSTFYFLLISQKSFYRIFRKNVFKP